MSQAVDRRAYPLLALLLLSLSSLLFSVSAVDHQTGTLLEVVTYDWCHADCGPFNTESVFVCVQADARTLIGERKLGRDWREYFSQISSSQGKPVTLRYDNGAIWLVTSEGKEFGFNQRYDEDLMHSPECTAEIHRHMLKSLGTIDRPASVPSDAVLIPEGGRFFWHYYSWVSCSFDTAENENVCVYWDKTGRKDYESHVVSDKDGKPVPQTDLQIDAYTTRRNEVRLKNGVTLVSDGRSRINGKLVNEQAKP
jgi:hypothetical protein